jgi:cysteine desulfurase
MIYLDNAATTKADGDAAALMIKIMTEEFGNPSSLHKLGISAERHLCRAREQTAKALSCTPDEVCFTSGGTEGNNTAVFGAANAMRRRGKHIITTSVEHPSVLEPMKRLSETGFDVTFLKPGKDGKISEKQVLDALREDTVLISIMSVNNETGAVFPVKRIVDAVKGAGSRALVHTDAVQAFLKLSGPPALTGADIITVSGHKIHAPKGVGALYIKKGVRLVPLMYGGGQEKNMRPGTEALPLIAAFGHVCAERLKTQKSDIAHMNSLMDILCESIKDTDGVSVICRGGAPHIISLAFERYPSEVSMRMLENRGIYISSGSACGRGRRSHVLKEMDVPDKTAACAARVSLSRYTTKQDILALAGAIKELFSNPEQNNY